MKCIRRTIIVLAVLAAGLQASAQSAVRQYIAQLRTTDELKEAVWGIKAAKVGGEVVADYGSTTRMMPASNVKVLTTGLVLNELGSDYRFRTRLAYTGEIVDGVLDGDLYIVGGGDPTIGARDSVATALQSTFSQWERIVRAAGIKRIGGRVVGDGRWLDCEPQNPSWQLEDAATGDGTVMTGLSFGGGLQAFNITAGVTVGAPAKVEAVFPEVPWMTFRHTCTTSAQGTGEDLFYDCTDLAPVAAMTGSVPLGTRSRRVTCTNSFGALTCAFYFYRYLENQGIVVDEGPADIDPRGCLRDFGTLDDEALRAAPQESLHYIGEYFSPKLKDIVRQTNTQSDNYYAEAMLRVLARERTGSACMASCRAVSMEAFNRLGVRGADRVQIYDGSGLARKNYITPDFFVRFLTAMRKSAVADDFRRSLPRAGSGTLASRLQSAPESVRSRVFMKSGSMNGVRCFSGYIMPSSGREEDIIAFSILTNNTVTASSRINFIMDKLIGLMAAEN